MSSEQFKTQTEIESLRRMHVLTVKVMAFAFIAITLVSLSFAGSVAYTVYTVFASNVEISTAREIHQDANTMGDSSPVNQRVGK